MAGRLSSANKCARGRKRPARTLGAITLSVEVTFQLSDAIASGLKLPG
jgi:hypothetical protein